MEYEPIITGGAGAGVVWLILRVIGRWAARNRWKTITSTEPVELIAKERDHRRTQLEAARRDAASARHEADLRVAKAESEAAAERAVARTCRAHMDKMHGVREES